MNIPNQSGPLLAVYRRYYQLLKSAESPMIQWEKGPDFGQRFFLDDEKNLVINRYNRSRPPQSQEVLQRIAPDGSLKKLFTIMRENVGRFRSTLLDETTLTKTSHRDFQNGAFLKIQRKTLRIPQQKHYIDDHINITYSNSSTPSRVTTWSRSLRPENASDILRMIRVGSDVRDVRILTETPAWLRRLLHLNQS